MSRKPDDESAQKREKLVVSHRGALVAKYGAKGAERIEAALRRMARADKARGIVVYLVYLDAPGLAGIAPVSKADSAAQAKRCIDRICAAMDEPDYLLILGGPDVVPHQPLNNPILDPAARELDREDEEPVVPSDLPYACAQVFSKDAKKFVGPTRAVGRLPDEPGADDPARLIGLLDRAADAGQLRSKRFFGLSAEVWRGATGRNLEQALGASGPAFFCCPKEGPAWKKALIARPLHLINCHGDTHFSGFFGEDASGEKPLAIGADALAGRVSRDTVVASECCYGAELYAPEPGEPKGMALSYLEEGAAAYLGSSTIAYGGTDAEGVASADVLCSRFLRELRNGATAGRALLVARQALMALEADPPFFDLKTLAQFMLLGDPSYRAYPESPAAPAGIAEHRSVRKSLSMAGRALKRQGVPASEPTAPTVSPEQVVAAAGLAANWTLSGFGQFRAPDREAAGVAPVHHALMRKSLQRAGVVPAGAAPPRPRGDAVVVASLVRADAPKDMRAGKPAAAPASKSARKSAVRERKRGPRTRMFVVARVVGGEVVSSRVLSTR